MNNQTENTQLKEMPMNTTKDKIQKMYVHLAEYRMRIVINHAILEVNKTLPEKLQQSIRIKKLNRRIVLKIVEIAGLPSGYKLSENYKNNLI